MSFHDFNDRVAFSEGIGLSDSIENHIINSIGGAYEIVRANLIEDKSGVDYWVLRNELKPLSIDVKHRSFCPIEKYGSDDACIETTSVYKGPNNGNWLDKHRLTMGWTLNKSKQTDYILYTWPYGNKLRFWILPFPFLCVAAQKHWQQWAEKYTERPARNDGYLTLAIYPPRKVIALAMKELMGGIA